MNASVIYTEQLISAPSGTSLSVIFNAPEAVLRFCSHEITRVCSVSSNLEMELDRVFDNRKSLGLCLQR
jgi:hypothetical protein